MKKILISTLAICLSGAAYGKDEKKTFVGIEYGHTTFDDNRAELNAGIVGQVGGTVTSTMDTTLSSGRIFGGYRYDNQKSVEIGYVQSGDLTYRYSGTTGARLGNAAYTGSATVDYSGFDLSLRYRLFEPTQMGAPIAKIGIHRFETKALIRTVVGTTVTQSTTKENGVGTLFGLGYEYPVSQDIFVSFVGTRYLKIAGESENKATVWSAGLTVNF